MTNISVKDTYSVMSKAASSGIGKTTNQTGSPSFESIFSNQADKSDVAENVARKSDTVYKNDVNGSALKSKDVHKSVVKEDSPAEEIQRDIETMDDKEWEDAMEVLGSAAAEVIQQLAEAFDMTVEEVESLMAGLGMEQLDVLQQQNLGELILAVAGVDSTAHLLTDEALYSKYQEMMENLSVLLDRCSDELQMDAGQLLQMNADALEAVEDAGQLPIEVIVDVDSEQNDEPMQVTNGASDVWAKDATGEVVQDAQSMDNAQEQTRGDGKEEHALGREHSDQGRIGGNLLLQNLKADAFEPQLQQVSQTASSWNTETVDIMRQIMDHMRIHVKPDMSNLEMQLHPESLGTLHVNVAAKDGAVTAQFITQNEAVKAAVESQLIQLKESFLEQGVKVDAIEVTVQTHQFEQNLEQGRNSQQSEPDKKNRIRRIRLEGDISPEELDGMEEAEQLTAQMMAANGNTVDYTA